MTTIYAVLKGLFFMMVGAFFLWMGAIQTIGSMMPKEAGLKMAEAHGAWVRENVLKLPPIEKVQP